MGTHFDKHTCPGCVLLSAGVVSRCGELNKTYACMLSCFSRVRLFMTLHTIACQAPLSMGFSRQEYWSRLPCPPPEDLLDLGIKLASLCLLHWQASSLPLAPLGKPHPNLWKSIKGCLRASFIRI